MPAPFYEPVVNGTRCRSFATVAAANRAITRWLKREGGHATLNRHVSASVPPVTVASFQLVNGKVVHTRH